MVADSRLVLLLEDGSRASERLSLDGTAMDVLARGGRPSEFITAVASQARQADWRITSTGERRLRLLYEEALDFGVPAKEVAIPAEPIATAEELVQPLGPGEDPGRRAADLAKLLLERRQVWVSVQSDPVEAQKQVDEAARTSGLSLHVWRERSGFTPPLPWNQGRLGDACAAIEGAASISDQSGPVLFVFWGVEAALWLPDEVPGPANGVWLRLLEAAEADGRIHILVITGSQFGRRPRGYLRFSFAHVVLGSDDVGTPTLDELVNADHTAGAESRAPMEDVDGEVRAMERALLSGTNVILVGPPGAGKTALVEELGRRIASGEIDPGLKDRRILEVRADAILAGTHWRGDLEERVKNLIAEVKARRDSVIVFIDEVHVLRQGESSRQVMQALKGALARGDFPMIGATTDQELSVLSSDQAFMDRFVVVRLQAPHGTRLKQIVRSHARRLAADKKRPIGDAAIDAIAELSEGLASGDAGQPRRAIDLLKQAYQVAHEMHAREVELEHVRAAAQSMGARMPADTDEMHQLQTLGARLKRHLLFQDHAMDRLAQAIIRLRVNPRPLGRPYLLLMLGPSGVGKTSAAKALACELFGDENALHQFDMARYVTSGNANDLVGAPTGYVGSEQPSGLVLAAQRRPRAVYLFDELERAHSRVPETLMNIVNDGFLVDSTGTRGDFSQAIFLFASNLIMESDARADDLRTEVKRAFWEYAQQPGGTVGTGVPAPFVNRLDDIILFDRLTQTEIQQIARELLDEELASWSEVGVHVSLSPSVDDYLSKSYLGEEGARAAHRRVEEIISALAMWRVHNPDGSGRLVARYDPDSNEITFSASGDTP